MSLKIMLTSLISEMDASSTAIVILSAYFGQRINKLSETDMPAIHWIALLLENTRIDFPAIGRVDVLDDFVQIFLVNSRLKFCLRNLCRRF
jgi:hypothetical protein